MMHRTDKLRIMAAFGGITAGATAWQWIWLKAFSSSVWKAPPYTPPLSSLPCWWAAAYVVLSLAAYSVAVAGIHENSVRAMRLYVCQILCGLPLPFFFFRTEWRLGACVWAALTALHTTGLLTVFRRIRPIAYLLGVFYLVWVAFVVYWYLGLFLLN